MLSHSCPLLHVDFARKRVASFVGSNLGRRMVACAVDAGKPCRVLPFLRHAEANIRELPPGRAQPAEILALSTSPGAYSKPAAPSAPACISAAIRATVAFPVPTSLAVFP